MLEMIKEMLSYQFMVRAVIVGLLVALCASLLGVSMVLKRYSMIGDGLSHVGFAALAVAQALNVAPLKIAIPVCIIAAVLLLRISNNSKIKGDSAVAILCSGSLAVGVMVISLSSGMNTDVNNYMFGSILALTKSDMILSVCLAAVVIPVFVLLYNSIFAVTFDPDFARATGTRVGIFDTVIAVLTAVTIVLGMRLMGTLLISSLIVFPPLTSMRVTKSFRGTVTVSSVIPVFSFVSGLMISYFCSTPPGASVVCVNIALFAVFALIGALKKRS